LIARCLSLIGYSGRACSFHRPRAIVDSRTKGGDGGAVSGGGRIDSLPRGERRGCNAVQATKSSASEYPNAHHGFDDPRFTQKTQGQGHTLEYNDQAYAQAIKDMKDTVREVFGVK
jgi:dienelactone hydrolase